MKKQSWFGFLKPRAAPPTSWRGFSLLYSSDGTLRCALTFHAEHFLRDGAELERSYHPPDLSIYDIGDHAAALAAMPELATKRRLTLGGLDDAGAAAFGASGLEVRDLTLCDCRLTPAGIRALVPLASRLERLSFDGVEIGDEGAELLAGAPFHALRSLSLRECNIGDAGVIALARSTHPHLRVLELPKNRLRAEATRALAASSWSANLETLDLGETMLFDEGVCALVEIPGPGPVVLDVSSCWITKPATIAALAAAPWTRLARLVLRDNRGPGEELEDVYDQGVLLGQTPVRLHPGQLAERFGFKARGVEVY